MSGLPAAGQPQQPGEQQGLLRFAALAVGHNVSARVEALRETKSPQLLIETLLPLDEQRRVEAEVWLAALVRSRVDKSLEKIRLQGWAGTRHICRLVVSMCDQAGPEEDLHTFVDGLTLQAVTYPDLLGHDELRAAVRRRLKS